MVDDQIYPLDSLREPVRLAAGLTPDKRLTEAAQQKALEALARFGERLRGLPPEGIRAVGTNTLRVAKNAKDFVARAEAALGVPIEVVAGREEARLIYLGVSHSLPIIGDKRLVVDIGGGSTEFIIGSGFRPRQLESLYMGCVTWSLKFFPGGRISKGTLKQAELAARVELETISREFSAANWKEAVGSSGTARTLGEILEMRGWSDGSLTSDGLENLHGALLKAGDVGKLEFPGLRPDRILLLPGGFAIMSAIFAELKIPRMNLATGAMRQGILYDMLGRFHHHDMRDATVTQFKKRYHVDNTQAHRVETLALHLLRQFSLDLHVDLEPPLHLLSWAAPARDRPDRRAFRLSQALRLYPDQRRHARLLQEGAGPPLAAGACPSRQTGEDEGPDQQRARPDLGHGAAPGGDVPPQPQRRALARDGSPL